MEMNRREFVKGGLATLGFLALPGGLFAVPAGFKTKKKPNLVFGVVSDTHMRTHYDGVSFYEHYGTLMGDEALKAVFRYFKGEEADAVVNCGDLTDRGIIRTMELYKAAWDGVFKGTRTVHLYATGNHDVEEMFRDWAMGIARSEDPETYNKIRLGCNLDSVLERIWGEPYEDIWHKTVKGYHFFGMGWGLDPDNQTPVYRGRLYNDSEMEGRGCSRFIHNGLWMAELVRREREAGRLDPQKPFFTVYHCSIGRYDRPGARIHSHLRSALGLGPDDYCNGLGFFGHAHRSNADWHFFWDRNAAFPAIECASLAYWKHRSGEGDKPVFAQGFGDGTAEGGGQDMTHALLVKVYDDMMTIRRVWVEVKPKVRLATLGPDLAVPLAGFAPSRHPLLPDRLRGSDAKPEFPKDAKLEVKLEKRVGVGERNDSTLELQLETPTVLRIRIPRADGNPLARVYGYNVVIAGEGGAKVKKSVYENGYSYGDGCEPDGGVTTLEIPALELPAGKNLTLAVRPCSCLASRGRPLVATYSTMTNTLKARKA